MKAELIYLAGILFASLSALFLAKAVNEFSSPHPGWLMLDLFACGSYAFMTLKCAKYNYPDETE